MSVWSHQQGLQQLTDSEFVLESMCFSPDGAHLLTATAMHVSVWNLERLQCVCRIPSHGHGIAVHPSGRVLAAVRDDWGSVSLFSLRDSQLCATQRRALLRWRRTVWYALRWGAARLLPTHSQQVWCDPVGGLPVDVVSECLLPLLRDVVPPYHVLHPSADGCVAHDSV